MCSISSGTVSFIGAGTCVIDADQAGNANYDPAAQQRQSFTVVKSPSVQISSPADGQTFALGQHVVTSFSCAEGTDGPGLSACTDASGARRRRVSLIRQDWGRSATTSSPPARTVRLRPPASPTPWQLHRPPRSARPRAARYTRSASSVVNYICQDGASGPGIRSCTGTLPTAQPRHLHTRPAQLHGDRHQPGRPIHHHYRRLRRHPAKQPPGRPAAAQTPLRRHVHRHCEGARPRARRHPRDCMERQRRPHAPLQPAAGRFAFARAHATSSTAKTIQIVGAQTRRAGGWSTATATKSPYASGSPTRRRAANRGASATTAYTSPDRSHSQTRRRRLTARTDPLRLRTSLSSQRFSGEQTLA